MLQLTWVRVDAAGGFIGRVDRVGRPLDVLGHLDRGPAPWKDRLDRSPQLVVGGHRNIRAREPADDRIQRDVREAIEETAAAAAEDGALQALGQVCHRRGVRTRELLRCDRSFRVLFARAKDGTNVGTILELV